MHDVLGPHIRAVPKKQMSGFPVPASQRYPRQSQPILILRYRVRFVFRRHASDRRTSLPQRAVDPGRGSR
jgi:hypothetical protein